MQFDLVYDLSQNYDRTHMNSIAYQPIVRVLLVIASIHMLGACPCGCLEENGWYQTAIAFLTSENSASDRSLAIGNNLATANAYEVSEADCDEEQASFITRESNRRFQTMLTLAASAQSSTTTGNLQHLDALNSDSYTRMIAAWNESGSLVLRARSSILRL